MKPLKQVVYLPTSKENTTAVCNFNDYCLKNYLKL